MCKSRNTKKPILLAQPYDIEAIEGTTVELPCQAESDVKVEVTHTLDQ